MKKLKKLAALVLTLCMVVNMNIVSAFAQPEEGDPVYVGVEIDSYTGSFKDMDGSETSGHLWEELAVGDTIAECLESAFGADHQFLSEDPVKADAVFEGWLEFSYSEESVDDVVSRRYELVSDEILTTQDMLTRPIPAYNVCYAAKWDCFDIDEYYYSGDRNYFMIDADGGTFDYRDADSADNISAVSRDAIPGKTVGSVIFELSDPVYWNPNRSFLGWMICEFKEVYNEEYGDYIQDWVQVEGTELLTTEELLAYPVNINDIAFFAKWEGDDDDYYGNVVLDTYDGTLMLYPLYDDDGNRIESEVGEEYIGAFHFDAVPGEDTIGKLLDEVYGYENRWAPEKGEDVVFEGWAEFKMGTAVDEEGNEYDTYELVSDDLYGNQELMNMPVPEYRVTYAAKWSDVQFEDYYFDGNYIWTNFELDGGTFTVDDSEEMGWYVVYAKEGRPISSSVKNIAEPVYWNTNRKFEGWKLYRWGQKTDQYGGTYETYIPLTNRLFTTDELYNYEVPAVDEFIIMAQWSAERELYESDVTFSGYGGVMNFQYTEDGETRIDENDYWSDTLRLDGTTFAKQMTNFNKGLLVSDPVMVEPGREDAVFEGWLEYEVVITVDDRNQTFEEYVLKSEKPYTTSQILNKKVPDYHVYYVAKWSDMDISDYFADIYVMNLYANGGTLTFQTESEEGAENLEYEAFFEQVKEGETFNDTMDYWGWKYISCEKDCASLSSWSLYSFDDQVYIEVPKGEKPAVIKDTMVFYSDTYEINDGEMVDGYVRYINCKLIDNLSTEKVFSKISTQDMFAVANWKTDHNENPIVIENIKDSTHDRVVYCADCGLELSRETVKVEQSKVAVEVEGSNEKHQVVVDSALVAVPEVLKETYQEVGDVEKALESAAAKENEQLESKRTQIQILDVELQVETEEGVWEKVTADNFPETGITIVLPYPEGTNADKYEFVVTHMITTGEKAGQVEVLPCILTEEGLKVTVTSLSPIAVSYLMTEHDFTDLKESKYYYNPVLWAVENKVTSGKTATTFAPEATCTRGQIMTFLWNAMGKPEPTSYNHNFTDIKEGSYYYKAVLWAVENGVTSGRTATTFAPNEFCTRGQIMTFLWNALGKPEPVTQRSSFTDLKEGAYYYKPVLWAVENGVTSGRTSKTFAPGETCTRGQAMTFLYNALVK